MILIESNGVAVIGILERFIQAIPAADHAGTRAVGQAIRHASLEEMEPLYWVADPGLEPTGRGYLGRAEAGWTRIGALRAAERLIETGSGFVIKTQASSSGEIIDTDHFILQQEALVDIENKTPERYAEWRYYKGREVGSRWREKGLEKVEPELPAVYAEAFSKLIPGALLAG